MKAQVLQENLSRAVSLASHFTNARAQLPVLGNILLSTKKTKLLVSSTNLETSVAIAIGAKIEREGEITVPSKVISELVTNLKQETISLSVEKEQLKIEAYDFSSIISGMNSADFPSVSNIIDAENALVLLKDEFLESLSQVLFCTSIDETRPILTGILFVLGKKNLTLVATDGFRLSKKTFELEGKDIGIKLVLPKGVLSELGRATSDTDKILFSYNEKENQVLFGFEDTILSSRIIEGSFPDFEKIIPQTFLYRILVDREELLRAIKLASVFAREGGNIVRLVLKENSLEILAESAMSGSQKTKLDIKVEKKGSSPSFEIAFNFRFLEEFLQSLVGEEVCLEFSSDDKPGVFTDPKDKNLLHLIMPVKIQS